MSGGHTGHGDAQNAVNEMRNHLNITRRDMEEIHKLSKETSWRSRKYFKNTRCQRDIPLTACVFTKSFLPSFLDYVQFCEIDTGLSQYYL